MGIPPSAFLVVEASWAWSVAIDFGKLFSSSFNFSSFYTARDKTGKAQCDHMFSALPLKADIAQCSWHVRKPSQTGPDEPETGLPKLAQKADIASVSRHVSNPQQQRTHALDGNR